MFAHRLAAILLLTSVASAQPPITALTLQGDTLWSGSQIGVQRRNVNDQQVSRNEPVEISQISLIVARPDRLIIAGGWPGEGGAVLETTAVSKQSIQWQSWSIGGGMRDVVSALDQSPDERAWAIGCLDGTVHVTDPHGSQGLATFVGHSDRVTSVVWVNDQLIASAGLDHTIRVWKASDGTLVRVLNNHTGPVRGLTRQPGVGKLPVIASIGDDRTVRFWQPTIGRMMRFIRLESDSPTCLAWNADGTILWVGTTGGDVLAVDPRRAEVIERMRIDSDWVTALAVRPSGGIYVGTAKGDVRWEPDLQ